MPVILNQPNSIGPQQMLKSGFNDDVLNAYPDPSLPRLNGYSNTNKTPPYLRQLAASERVIVRQRKEWLEIVLGCETQNRYEILDEQNEVIYTADESSEFCMRCWCGPLRPIHVSIKDNEGIPVIVLNRPLACQEFCFPCCLQKMSIASPPGNSVGSIEQKWGLKPELHVKDGSNSVVFIIKGPLCQFSCRCGDVEFPVYASDGVSECGKISKRWRGILHEAFTDADIFGVKFPPGINANMKVLLMAATFLVDYMYFEHQNQ